MPVRLTEQQYRSLGAGQQRPAKASKGFRLTPGRVKLSENDVERQICDFLRIRGWTVVRQQSGLFRRVHDEGRVRVGGKGCADWYAVRPCAPSLHGESQFFYFEVKAPGRKPDADQKRWLALHQQLGFLAEWFDSVDSFAGWYQQRFGK